MTFKYDFNQLKNAIKFNTVEVLPTDDEQLDKEIARLVEAANNSGQKIKHYIGFEISGKMHFPGSVYQMLSVAKLQAAGVEVSVWLADYHTWINKKLDGKMTTIRKVAKEYFEPLMRESLNIAGGNGADLKVLYAEDEYFKMNNKGLRFWDYEFEVGKHMTLARVLRSLSVAGKEDGQGIDYQITRYPGMQAADIFWLQTHIVQSGLDQRKIYVSSRDMAYKLDEDYRLELGHKQIKPITIFNNLLLGMEPPKTVKTEDGLNKQEINKMSKSKPDSAIWVHDNFDEISRKLKKAYCPMPQEGQIIQQIQEEQKWNPLLDWSKKMIFTAGKTLEVRRPEKFGGDIDYTEYSQLESDYFAGKLHPMDFKDAMARLFSQWFEPAKLWAEKNQDILFYIEESKKK